jgi:hypothetical protein
MATFAQGLVDHEYMMWERLAKFKRETIFKTMSKYCWDYKKIGKSIMKSWFFMGF